MSRSSFRAMGVDVVVGGSRSEMLLDDVRPLVCSWDAIFSRFRADSELNRVNASAAEVVVVSDTFARAVRAAHAAAGATDGLVDPTLGGALVAAGYDRDFAQLPGDAGPPDAGAPGTWRSVSLAGRLLSRPPGVVLDLNGVVKGMVVDDAVRLLPAGSFVSAGGDLAASGPVVVALPRGGSIRLDAGGLATSGTTERRWTRGGVVQHHLIDPRTGRPARSRWDEVTVAAASCLTADVAAKAAFLLSDDGPGWLDERGLPGRFVSGTDAVENDTWRLALRTDPVAA
jgi:FAD:protein FMN transferase